MATTPSKTGRRVLGDISVNTPSKLQTIRTAEKGGASLAERENYATESSVLGAKNMGHTSKQLLFAPGKDGSTIGKKRSIHEVEGIEQWSEPREAPLSELTRSRLSEERVTLQRQESRENSQIAQTQQTNEQPLDQAQLNDERVCSEDSTPKQTTPAPTTEHLAPNSVPSNNDASTTSTPPHNHATPQYHPNGPESVTQDSFSSVIDYSPPDTSITEQRQQQQSTESAQSVPSVASVRFLFPPLSLSTYPLSQ
ncbi:hypothetical protein L228DRAFT_147018 [Xylona heveae TC161]|uniref:Uncharacterized protein n=1 Tax=Xylona heveae (strain CBS 132557 / TC161) TaxID=1328760 RepID=A0A165GFW4_XYLHT|nr:hypothetical protein L228DRAFT_147018 [Xylona heveae TC161]KZF22133.1 hypothetical protein L228DRAFT_147018 [Xylona heveae TC161]